MKNLSLEEWKKTVKELEPLLQKVQDYLKEHQFENHISFIIDEDYLSITLFGDECNPIYNSSRIGDDKDFFYINHEEVA